MVWGNNSM